MECPDYKIKCESYKKKEEKKRKEGNFHLTLVSFFVQTV